MELSGGRPLLTNKYSLKLLTGLKDYNDGYSSGDHYAFLPRLRGEVPAGGGGAAPQAPSAGATSRVNGGRTSICSLSGSSAPCFGAEVIWVT